MCRRHDGSEEEIIWRHRNDIISDIVSISTDTNWSANKNETGRNDYGIISDWVTMKISDEAVLAACRLYHGDVCVSMREAILAALTTDGYPKLLAEALAIMRETGWSNAVDHATSADGVIELAAYETYNELCRRVYADGGIISGHGGLMGA